MKKILSALTLLLCISLTSGAAAFKFYVNPGHGGHDSDDRPTPLPMGLTPQFYESDGNLDRGNHVCKYLSTLGVAYRVSRTTNNSSDDLNLTSIASYSSSYGGYFWSLHSNGANASANYHVALYKGQNATNSISPSKNMAYQNSVWAYATNLTNATYNTPRGMADYDLMGWHYGVLRTNTQPGFLVECWFHDYRPEALRMKSTMYNQFTAWQTVRSAMDSPGGFGSKALKGAIVGDIRDLSASCGYTNYTARGRDTYLAVNGAKVELLNSSGAAVQTVTTDNFHNGVYFFSQVAAGTYTVRVSKSGYKTQSASVTVANNAVQKKTFDLVKGVDTGISVSQGAIGFGATVAGTTSGKTVTVTGAGLSSNISVSHTNSTHFSVSPASLGATGGTLNIVFKPQVGGNHTTTITLTSGSYKATIVVTGTATNPPLTFTEGWNYSENNGKKAAWMENYTNYRNMTFGNGKLYIVDSVNKKVIIVKAQTGEQIGTLNTDNVSGGALALIDLAYVDGKVIGCNIASKAASHALKVYAWDTDESEARVILETTNYANMDRIGDCIEVKGNLTSGELVFLGQQSRQYTNASGTTATGNCNTLVTYAISNGTVSTTPKSADIDGFIVGLSPRAVPFGNEYWVIGQNYSPSLITAAGELTASVPSALLNNDWCGNDIAPFTFNGTQYAFATSYDYNADYTQRLKNGRATLLDASAGWAEATAVGAYPKAGMGGTTRNTTYSTSICTNVNGTKGVEMWILVHNQGIAYYKHGTAPVYNFGPTVSASASTVNLKTTEGYTAEQTITVSGANLEGDINIALSGANADLFTISTTSIAKATASGSVKITYKPEAKGTHTAKLTITSANATPIEVTINGTCEYNTYIDTDNIKMTKVWEKTTTADWYSVAAPKTRHISFKDGKLYVVNATPATINIVDAYTGAAKGTMSVEGVTGGAIALSNLVPFDGKFFGSTRAAATATSGTSAHLKIYRWDSETATPVVVKEETAHASIAIGGKMHMSGNLTKGRAWFANGSTVLYFDITNGNFGNVQTIALTKDGAAYNVGANAGESEIYVEADGTFWVDGKDRVPARFSATGAWIEDMASIVNGSANAFQFITFGSRKLVAATTYLNTAASTLANGAFVLADIAGGMASATAIATYPEAGFNTTSRNTDFMTSVCASTRENGAVLDVWVNVTNQGIAHYTYNGQKYVGVENIVIEDAQAPVEYYNLQGVKVANPENGLYIRVQGNKVSKVIVK